MTDDVDLWREYPIHDKAFLCRLLRQPFVVLPGGAHWVKPVVSIEGLGYHAERLELAETCIAQPEASGEYLNVEVSDANGTRCWTAERKGKFFAWFECRDDIHLGGRRHWSVTKILKHCEGAAAVTIEFIGDVCIEAHARGSGELSVAYRYTIPVWRRPGDGWVAPGLDFVRVGDDDEPIDGLKRRAMLLTNENPRELHDAHCLCGA